MKKLILLSCFVILSLKSFSQEVFTIHVGWADMTMWYKLNENTKIGGDFGYRTTFDHFDYHVIYVRPTIVYSHKPIYSVSFAASNFHTFFEGIDVNEVRFAQQATLKWPTVGPFRLTHRLRFEERFFYVDNSKEDQIRGRYRIALKLKDFKLFGENSRPFYTEGTFETFVPLIDNTYNDILGTSHRIEAVIGNKITKKLKIGIHYIWQTTRLPWDVFDLQENIFRVRIGYKLN